MHGNIENKFEKKGMGCHRAGFISSFEVGFLFVFNSFKIINRKVL